MLRSFFLFSAALLLAGAARAQGPATPRLGLQPSYSLSAGAMFAGRYGSASYLSPTVSVPVSRRLSVFGGVTYLRVMPGSFVPYPNFIATDAASSLRVASHHYLLQGGGQYALSPRLTLTGSAWKDLTPTYGASVNPYAGFGGNLGSGVNLRADYHITENFSVSGGLRVSNGATAYPGSTMYGPGMGW